MIFRSDKGLVSLRLSAAWLLLLFGRSNAGTSEQNLTQGSCSPIFHGDNNTVDCPPKHMNAFQQKHQLSAHASLFGSEVWPGGKLKAVLTVFDGYKGNHYIGETDNVIDFQIFAVDSKSIVSIFEQKGTFFKDFTEMHPYGVEFSLPKEPLILVTCLVFRIPDENDLPAVNLQSFAVHLPKDQVEVSPIGHAADDSIFAYTADLDCVTMSRSYAMSNFLFRNLSR